MAEPRFQNQIFLLCGCRSEYPGDLPLSKFQHQPQSLFLLDAKLETQSFSYDLPIINQTGEGVCHVEILFFIR
jgi:hypothetical protein